uniref:NADH-ubiquinone oxidoreductase chain 2 n=1 Tax=Gymnothorax fimbriatus TaxID=473455 RepID=A0A8K1L3H8_9TELE|nr:NADH dehydrogenase subunit 2 [Gymnothorax fimbriatus]UDF87702.1 NADH dehydrogenase subunit 2 [Gymnothorax fimbriatus]UEX93171.1 NADH dehydrogenase subunit 2 [Gymnothorax fimbriatus]
MNPWVMFILIASLGLGTTITFASTHWLLAWMGLEINTLAIIPLMAQHHHPRAVEATTKYFLTQAAAAALLLFAATSNAWMLGTWHILQPSHPLATTITMISLGMKVGLAPIHLWLPEVLQGLDLSTGLILSTWQKLAPMILIYQIAPNVNPTLLFLLGTISALVGGWGGLNQTQIRKILAYSSIAHMGWMIIILKHSPNLMILNLMVYIIMTSTAFMTLKTVSTTNINTLATAWAKAPTMITIAMLTMLSLGGLPPLTGFMPKWMILQELTKQDLAVTATIMALSALLSLFFYLRLCYSMTLTSGPNTTNNKSPWRLKTTATGPLPLMAVASLIMLPITPTAMALLT